MTARAVIDSTCFIALEHIEPLELIPRLFQQVCAPPAVVEEIGGAPGWLLVQEVSNGSSKRCAHSWAKAKAPCSRSLPSSRTPRWFSTTRKLVALAVR